MYSKKKITKKGQETYKKKRHFIDSKKEREPLD